MKPNLPTTRRSEWIIVVTVATMIAFLFFGQAYMVKDEMKDYQWEESLLWTFTSWYMWAALFPLIFRLARRFRYDSKNWHRTIPVHIAAGFVIGSVHASILILIVHWLPHPERTFADILKHFGAAFPWYVFFRFAIYQAILAVCYALDYYRSARENEVNSIQVEGRILRAETQALKMQMEPKFVFRILDSLSRLMHENIKTAERLIARLGDYLRMTLDHAQYREIPLSKELEFVKCTTEIEKFNDQSAPTIQYHISPGSLDWLVPNRVVQTPIEVMLKRNRQQHEPSNQITVEADRDSDSLSIQIHDSQQVSSANEIDSLKSSLEAFSQAHPRNIDFSVQEQSSGISVALKINNQPENTDQNIRDTNISSSIQRIEYKDPPVNPVRRWGIIVLSFTAVAAYFFLNYSVGYAMRKEPVPWAMLLFESTTWYMWALLTPFILNVIQKYPLRKGLLLKNGFVHLLTNLAVYFYTTLGIALLQWIAMLGEGNLIKTISTVFAKTQFPIDILVYWTIVATVSASRYRRQYVYSEVRASKLHSQLARAQLQALKMQLHPHFLFNTLNSLSELMHEDIQAAEEMLDHLEHFLRLTVNNSEAQEVPFEQELEFLKCYLAIENVRFQDRLSIHMDIEPQALPVSVPNLLLQPIVENAIRHGIAPLMTPGKIEICAKRNNGILQVQVHDNGPGLTDDQRKTAPLKKGLGLSNTRERLQQLYGKGHRFQLENAPEGGLLVTVEIPADTQLAHKATGA
jgi:LytS/YehU family sensor histidine kinase